MSKVYVNGKEFSDKSLLITDPDFQSLDEMTKSILLNKLDPNEPIITNTNISLVPLSVTPRQLRIALIMSGFNLSSIDSFIDTLPSPQREIAKITWEYSVEINRDNPLLVQLAPMLGFSKEQLDQLFIMAATL